MALLGQDRLRGGHAGRRRRGGRLRRRIRGQFERLHGAGGRGGAGGGAIAIVGTNVIIDGAVHANGENPPGPKSDVCGYRAGGGGGSGGAVLVAAGTKLLGAGTVAANGGQGGEAFGETSGGTWAWSGGGGGGGRVKLFSPSIALPDANVAAAGGAAGTIPNTSSSSKAQPGAAGTTNKAATIPAAWTGLVCQ